MRTKTLAQAEKILAAAARLFASHHFHEARMEDIADLAEVGKGTLYRYFQDKEELYMALLTRAGDQMTERLAQVAEAPGTARARLEAVVEAIIDFNDEHPHLLELIQHADAMHRPDADLPSQRLRRHNVHLVESIFEDARLGGEFEIEDPHLTALLLLGGLRPVIRCGGKPRPPGLAHLIVDQYLFGAARPALGCIAERGARGVG